METCVYVLKRLDARGFGIAEILVASGLLGVVMLGMTSMFDYQNKTILTMRTTSSRDTIKSRLDRYVGDPRALRNSATSPLNKDGPLDWCVNGTSTCGTPPCCIAGTSFNFKLLDPSPAQSEIAGVPSSPIVYATDGTRCAGAPTSNCPIIALSSFSASCGGAASCAVAKQITVNYEIEVAPGVALAGGTPLKTQAGSVVLSVPLDADSSTGSPDFLAKWGSSSALVASTVYEKNGAIGVGTTSPSSKLHVFENAPSATEIQVENRNASSNAYAGLVLNSNAAYTQLVSASAANGGRTWLQTNSAAGMDIASYSSSGYIRLATSKVDNDPIIRMVVDPSGQVGIGTDNPQAMLDVAGVVRVAKYSAEPFGCDNNHDGSLALSNKYQQCVCKGTSRAWVLTTDGTTPCLWN